MFEFVTISSGVAVVQNASTGQVYRFRPIQPGQWDRLTLNSVDVCEQVDPDPATHASAALRFAEDAAYSVYRSTLEACHPAHDSSRAATAYRRSRWLTLAKTEALP